MSSSCESFMSPEDFVRFIARRRFTLADESALQREIAAELEQAGAAYEREVRLSSSDRVDFMLPGNIAVEIKLKGQRRAVFRQCERYVAHDNVRGLILVTNLTMGFPQEINGKPCWVASLGRAWL